MKTYVFVNKKGEYLTGTIDRKGCHVGTKNIKEAQTSKRAFVSGIPHDVDRQLCVIDEKLVLTIYYG